MVMVNKMLMKQINYGLKSPKPSCLSTTETEAISKLENCLTSKLSSETAQPVCSDSDIFQLRKKRAFGVYSNTICNLYVFLDCIWIFLVLVPTANITSIHQLIMPVRNTVPTLKHLCIRQIAWPEGLLSNGDKDETSVEEERNTRNALSSVASALFRRKPSCKKLTKTAMSFIGSTNELADDVANAWIRLSNYYEINIDKEKQLKKFLSLRNISTLDFLHDEYTQRDGTNWVDIAGLIPASIIPQPFNQASWKAMLDVLKCSGNSKTLQKLSISFSLLDGPSGPRFKFLKGTSFPELTKLEVVGAVDDNFMKAVGISCANLRFLDIRGCKYVTEYGVLLMLFKKIPDIKKLSVETPIIPEAIVQPLTKKLQYFDMSTVPLRCWPVDIIKVVVNSCVYLKATPNRFFFYPGGCTKFRLYIDKTTIEDLRSKILTSHTISDVCLEVILSLVQMFRINLQFGISQVEVRSNIMTHEESGILFYHFDTIIAHVKMENLTVLTLTACTASAFDFVSLDVLAQSTPLLHQIKAPLKGQLSRERPLPELKSVTSSMIYSVDTLKSIILYSYALQYLEVREMYLSTNGEQLCDYDIHEMMINGPYEALEVFRILFPNQITLVPGFKEITLNCPSLRVLGDVKYCHTIPFKALSTFFSNMSAHNFDFNFEFDGVLYATNTPCKEFKRQK